MQEIVGTQSDTPKGYRQATCAKYIDKWFPPMQTQYDSLMDNETWDLVPRGEMDKARQQGLEVYWIQSVWKYRTKWEQGKIVKLKARLCANGMFMKCSGKDTFAPTANKAAVKLMAALAASYGCYLYSGDIPSAYVKASIDPKMAIFMEQPKGFVQPGKEGYVCRLRKALYGIPPAGCVWYKEVSSFIQSIGFSKSKHEPCLFYKWKGDDLMCISLTTDDFLLFSTCDKMREEVIKQLQHKFDYEDKGIAEWFVGIKITQDETQILLDQYDYATSISSQWPEVNPADAPAWEGDSKFLVPREEEEEKATIDMRSLLGELRYLTMTIPEIELYLNQVAQFQNDPSMKHQEALLRVVGFIKKHPYIPLRYPKSERKLKPHEVTLSISGTSDSSLGNSYKRHSFYGYNVYVNNMLVMHRCKLAGSVAKSTPEAEYIAMSENERGVKNISNMLRSIGLEHDAPATLRNDCASGITIVEKEQLTQRNMHIDIAFHSVRDAYEKGEIIPIKIGTEVNETDVYTKKLCRVKFWRCIQQGRNYEIDDYGNMEEALWKHDPTREVM
jgi:hypothetical protein